MDTTEPGGSGIPDDFDIRRHLLTGHVIPAHPLALTSSRMMDERHQKALTRYYVAAGAGGIAVGVHTTGFPIHDGDVGLYRPVLELAAETATAALSVSPRPFIRVAGLVGDTAQALREARTAMDLGYHCGLLSLGTWRDSTDAEIIAHCRRVSEAIPLFGFYLQPAVGGRRLGHTFWREFAQIANVVAVKIAPFDRYATLDVVRAVIEAGREDIALYTGNDDSIIPDLVTDFRIMNDGRPITRYFPGGLLGQWAVWTSRAVAMLNDIKSWREGGSTALPSEWLTRGASLTAANAVIFDAANAYRGCIPGILEVLRLRGLVRGTWTLDAAEQLSPGQAGEIARLSMLHPELADDAFVEEHIDDFLR